MYQSTHASVGQNQGRLPYARTAGFGGNCKLQNANCKLQISDLQPESPVPSRQPPAASLQSRRFGISLTEVLIAMGILTVGLLGVASIFPVASFYMQQGDVADRGSQIAQAAFNEALTRGTFDPANWLMIEDSTAAGKFPTTFSKPFASSLRDQLAANLAGTATPLQKQQILNRTFGSAYVIDPLAADSSPLIPTLPMDRKQARTVQTLPFNATLASYAYPSWWPWNPNAAPAVALNSPKWPVVRVTLSQPSPLPATRPIWPMTTNTADRLFRSNDDLAIDVPAAADRPSTQRLSATDLNGDGVKEPLARESRGDYSWIATVVPPTVEARNALATDPSSFDYEVSIVVFHKRIIDNLTTEAVLTERLTNAKVVSTGLAGGEMLLESTDANADPFGALKVGKWLMICGPSPASTLERPQFASSWYRVVSISDSANGIVTDSARQRLVGLRGPQWSWKPAANLTTADLSNNLCGVIVPNVVAVHSKTIRLGGNSSWSVQ